VASSVGSTWVSYWCEEERTAALSADDPLALPWIRASVDRLDEVLSDLVAPRRAPR
jgi:aspartate aminotransferase